MEQNSSTTRQFTDSKLRQGSYGNGKTDVKDFSRTIPGLFSFFKDSISSQFCITQRGLFSARSGEMKGSLDFFDSDNNNNLTTVIKTGTTAQIE